ncbi:MAG: hypothetical protein WC477_02295 [Patescibacteria group bacterium]
MDKKFKRTTFSSDHCPWCYKLGINTTALKKSVLRQCNNSHCAYRTYTPKKLLSIEERIKYYDPKRDKLMFGKNDANAIDDRTKKALIRYTRKPKQKNKNKPIWTDKRTGGIVSSLPKDSAAFGQSESSTSSFTQPNQ